MSNGVKEELNEARKRVELLRELDNAAVLINRIKDGFSKGTAERKLLLLIKNALFYAGVAQLDDFRSFLDSIGKRPLFPKRAHRGHLKLRK